MNAAYIETIRNKIINNPGKLLDEELSFIGVVPELTVLLVQELVKQKEAVIAEETTYIIEEKLLDVIPEDIKEEFWTMALGYSSATSLSLKPDEFESFLPMLNLEPSSIEKYKEQFIISIQNPNLEISKYYRLEEEGIILLLDNKRYDLFDQINQIPKQMISDDTYNRFINEYPDKEKDFLFITDYKYRHSMFDDITIEALINYYEFASDNKNDCLQLIIDRLNKTDDLSNLSLKIDWRNILSAYKTIGSHEEYEMFLKETFRKGYILNAGALLVDTNADIKEVKEKILKIINSKETSREYLRSILSQIGFIYLSDEYEKLRSDRDIIKSLVENDYLEIVLTLYLQEAILKNIDIIKDAIIQKKSTYFLKDMGEYIQTAPKEIIRIIADNCNVESIKTLYLPQAEEIEESLIKLIDKNVKINEIHFSNTEILNDEMVKKLIRNGYHDVIINNYFIITNKKYRNDIIDTIKEDSMFAFKIMSRYPRFILENDEILDVYLNAIDPIIEQLLSELNHDEHLTDLYNQHIYNKLKSYFCKKYKYDEEKLDLIEKHFGPTIIRFIDNENIVKIINLPKEDIEKIIKLFPKTDYTIDDIKASYESLVQYAFAKNKQKEHGLFATLMHAIQDNDANIINECKIELLNTIDYDMYEKLSKKYNLKQNTLGEYFEYIVNQIINGIDKQENIDSIHLIINEYVAIQRKKYHNNHFFDKNFSDFANLYESIVNAIDNKDHDALKWIVRNSMREFLTEDFYQEFAKHHEISDHLKDPYVLMTTIFEKITIPEKREKYLTILKFITDYCYEKKKKSKSKYLDLGQELELPYYIEPRSLEKAIEREVILGNGYYIIVDGERKNIVDLIAEKLEPEGIEAELVKDIIFDISYPEQNILQRRVTDEYNSITRLFNRTVGNLYDSGEIPFYSWEEATKNIHTTKLKTKPITLYEYLKEIIPDIDIYLIYANDYRKGEELFKNKYKKLIPKIIKTGKEIIKDNEVFEAYGYDIEETIYRSYINDMKYIYFVINGKTIPMAQILYDVLKDKIDWDNTSLYKYLFNQDQYAIQPPTKVFNVIIATVKELTSQYPVIYNNKEESTYDRDILKKIINKREANRVYIPDKTEMDPYEILANLNLNLLKQTILDDEEVYNKLLKIMESKKIHLFPESISKLLTSLDIDMSLDASNIAAFISYFPSILEEERKRYLRAGKEVPEEIPFTTAIILAEAEVFGTASSVFSQILGKEDAKLIKANPKNNQATLKLANNGRLKEAVSLTLECFQRKEVTVPPFYKEFKTPNGGVLIAICGNFTNPCNLTHGERTGACMRIGGAGESLFYFALKNKNGFHIRFEDPKTGEYVSRVTGFRNGNTVFLNELRYSCSQKYTNEDVVDVCTQVADELIELSKDSSCPIDNVVVTKYYAMDYSDKETTKLNVKNVKEGLGSFYSDVDENAVVLATTAEEGFTPVNLDKSNVPTYQTLRGQIKAIKSEAKMVSIINRVLSINELLSGKSYEDLSAHTIEDGFLYGIASEDWFIYVNEQLEIKYGIINIDPRAQEELSENLLMVENMINENKITKEESDSYGL